MTEDKQSRSGKWKKYVCIVVAVFVLTAGSVVIFFPREMYLFLDRFANHTIYYEYLPA